MITVAGIPGIHTQSPDVEFAPGRGRVLVQRFRGLEQDIRGLEIQLQLMGLPYVIRGEDGAFRTIELREPTGTNPVTTELRITWAALGNDLEKDIFTHPGFNALPAVERDWLRSYRANPQDSNLFIPPGFSPEFDPWLSVVQLKVETYTVSQFVVRRTATVANRWNGQAALTNTGKVFETTFDFTDTEDVPSTLKFVLPLGQWLKRTPTMTQNPNGTWAYVQEWWHADYWLEAVFERATL